MSVKYLVVIDFEATCGTKSSEKQPEIIEFPALVLNTETLVIEHKFHSYAKPTHQPVLDDFCINLTGIQQKTIDESENFDVVLQKFYSWLESISFINSSKEKTQDWIFLTVSDNDLKILITSQLICSQITQREEIFNQWIDLQKIFCWHYGYEKRKRLMHMLEYLEIRSEGSLHSGLDDSKNTAKIVVKMILDGAIFSKDDSTDWKPTKQWKKWDLLNKNYKRARRIIKRKKNHNNEKFFWDTSKTIYQQNSDFQKHLSKIGKSTTQKDYFDDSDDDMFFI